MPQPGKYGRKPPSGQPAIEFSGILTGTVPAHPASEDYLAALRGGWEMLGNDTAGDCVAVTWANVRRLVTTTLTSTPSYPSQDDVWAFYRTQNPRFQPDGDPGLNGPGSPCDNGMVIQTALSYLTRVGGPDAVKAVAYAKVDHTSLDEVKAALAIFGYLWTGLSVLTTNLGQFSAGQPWSYDAQAAVDGGHSVVTGGYGYHFVTGDTGALAGDTKFITWAEETSFRDGFWGHEVEECWAVIWPEHLGSKEFLAGIDVAKLAADYQALTGRPMAGA